MDITRFHAAFFEESREGLDAMEGGLLALESGGGDGETINVIFRAAHSIKGGAATFGFASVTDLTHLLETLLDEARAGRRTLDPVAIGVLLMSVDVLRSLLAACEHGGAIDAAALAEARAGLDALLAGDAVVAPTAAASADNPMPATAKGDWRIAFTPGPSLFMTGNDPLRILRELATHGELGVECIDARCRRSPRWIRSSYWLELNAAACRAPHRRGLRWVATSASWHRQRRAGRAHAATTRSSRAPAADAAPRRPTSRPRPAAAAARPTIRSASRSPRSTR